MSSDLHITDFDRQISSGWGGRIKKHVMHPPSLYSMKNFHAEIIKAVQLMEPTFGGINLEDLKTPECFQIEETLQKTMKIPVFHDDQHGTAIISGAALLNALELVGKDLSKVKVVFNGAGASGITCANGCII